jgi:hypothetical protein
VFPPCLIVAWSSRASYSKQGMGRKQGEPDWLGPKDEGEGAPANRAEARQVQKEEKKRRPRRDKDDEDLDKPEKKGFKVRVGTARQPMPPTNSSLGVSVLCSRRL